MARGSRRAVQIPSDVAGLQPLAKLTVGERQPRRRKPGLRGFLHRRVCIPQRRRVEDAGTLASRFRPEPGEISAYAFVQPSAGALRPQESRPDRWRNAKRDIAIPFAICGLRRTQRIRLESDFTRSDSSSNLDPAVQEKLASIPLRQSRCRCMRQASEYAIDRWPLGILAARNCVHRKRAKTTRRSESGASSKAVQLEA